MKKKIILDKIYISTKNQKNFGMIFDENHKKRPSWIKIKNVPSNYQFIKIIVNGENFWYRKYFENYYFPLNNTSEDYKNYYNEIAKSYDKYIDDYTIELGKKIGEFLKKNSVKKNSKILEIGAGTGLSSKGILSTGYNNLTLLDISKEMLEEASKKTGIEKEKLIVKDILNLDTKDKYNVVCACMSLDYFNEIETEKILKNINSVLEDNGIFICIDSHISKLFSKIFNCISKGELNLEIMGTKQNRYYFIGRKNNDSD